MPSQNRDTLQSLLHQQADADHILQCVDNMMEQQTSHLMDRLLHAESLVRLQAELLTTLSLEACTPLTTIIILCDVLRRHRERLSQERCVAIIDQIQAQTERLGQILNQLNSVNSTAAD
ncbi:MAG: hypothetical protein NZ750_10070 [Anaerolineae bacterium]|nr:hypothetical protein [Anaerolineae bacterium]MDW8172628.1 hypothetical protein [Anaerolineae bacterium]